MINNIIITGKYYNGKIGLDEGIKEQMGENWDKEWVINSTNLLSLNKEKGVAIVRISLFKEG